MKKSALTIFFGICVISGFSQTVFNGLLDGSDPIFNRPNVGIPPTSLSDVGTAVSYDLVPINIATTGLYDISTTSTWDNFLILYNVGGFNAASPLTNALVANDDLVSSSSGFSYNFTSPGTYYLVICSFKNGVTGPHTITLTKASTLPVKLNSFVAFKSTGNSVLFNWSSESDEEQNHYQIQRSADGNVFVDLVNGLVKAQNSTKIIDYSHTDLAPLSGINYYRLKITEKMGKVSYSSVVLVKNMKTGSRNIKLYPNPSSDYIQIETDAVQNSNGYVSIINTGGAILQSGQYKFNNNTVTTINIKQLPTGKYFLKTIIDKVETATLFIKN